LIGTASTGGGDFNGETNSSATTLAVGSSAMLIYKIDEWNWGSNVYPGGSSGITSSLTVGGFPAVMFSGMAEITNDQEGSTGPAYFSGTTVVDGLYVRSSC
jgi:hypothetical protein